MVAFRDRRAQSEIGGGGWGNQRWKGTVRNGEARSGIGGPGQKLRGLVIYHWQLRETWGRVRKGVVKREVEGTARDGWVQCKMEKHGQKLGGLVKD